MARVTMRRVREGEVPPSGGTAIGRSTGRCSRATGRTTTSAWGCGNVLAASMHEIQMTLKVRIRCARCRTVNVAITDIKGSPIRIR